jgi:hypothetical protein
MLQHWWRQLQMMVKALTIAKAATAMWCTALALSDTLAEILHTCTVSQHTLFSR